MEALEASPPPSAEALDSSEVHRDLDKRVVCSGDQIWLWDPGPRWRLRCFFASLTVMGVGYGCARQMSTTEEIPCFGMAAEKLLLCVVMGLGGLLGSWLKASTLIGAAKAVMEVVMLEMQTRSRLVVARRCCNWVPHRGWVSTSILVTALG
ncbi:uncharacterized protein LOC133707188 [Rosa rugosa]|uniref:uncharacterized protein LOC133707188 n=1 Tax=Rosa rugosa TaxID=74645 RepID=UPI002B40D703|nr:uncharacterized protein LOC133707188 [Rosa rugosa]